MKKACEKWKDPLREAALTGITAKDLEGHLRGCTDCAGELAELRDRATRLDALVPLMMQGAEPSADFRPRVLAAAEATRKAKHAPRPWRVWTLAGAAVAFVAMLIFAVTLQRRTARMIPGDELAAAQRLAEWRAPSDGLLATPGREILQTMPKIGQSYLNVPVKTDEEE
jgi:hypothetical protein